MAEVFKAAGQAAWQHILPVTALEKLTPPARWAEAITSPDRQTAVFIAELAGEVVGFAVVRPSPEPDANEETGELDSFYTDPKVWGQGAGRALMQAAQEFMRSVGFQTATLWTAELNHRPRRFYETAGWKLDGTTRHRSLHDAEFDELRYHINL
jgi:GNAT superfamily N-acetyltransferase